MEECNHTQWIHHFESVAPMHAVSYFTCKDCGYDTRIPPATASKSVDVGKLAKVLAHRDIPSKTWDDWSYNQQNWYLKEATAIKEAIERGEDEKRNN